VTCVAICSGKGSPGATFVAINLTGALIESGREALLIDLDSSGGDVAGYLGLDPRKGLYPLGLLGKGNYSPEALLGELEDRCGIPCISGFPKSAGLEPAELQSILTSACATGKTVVADLGRIDRRSAEVATSADLVLLTVRPDLISVHGAKRAKEILMASGVDSSRKRVVVSGWEWRHAADIAEIGESLDISFLPMIPLGRKAARRSLQAQTPVRHKRLKKAFLSLANEVSQQLSVRTQAQEVAVA
jgi:MinD-like ATPase involved in chromosome partitioning or flagellar assembly